MAIQQTRPWSKAGNVPAGVEPVLVFVSETPMMPTMLPSWITSLLRGAAPRDTLSKTLNDAERGDAQAQFDVGSSFCGGRRTVPDYEQAAAWYLKAANQDHAEAQFALGSLFADGRGVSQDDGKAIMWIRKAAQHGCAEAQHTLGLRCRRASFKDTREGAIEFTLEAYMWFRLASAQGCKGADVEFECLAVNMTQEQVNEGNRRVATFLATA